MIIIGVSGKMRTGKDSVAKYLVSKYGFRQDAFADPIKKLGMEYFGLTYEECYGEKTARSRKILQEIGKKWRDIDEDVWCRRVLKGVKEGEAVTISDIRFPNEAAMVKDYGGKIIRVFRNTGEQFGSEHESETALDDYQKFDVVIENNLTLEDLYKQIDQIMEKWGVHGPSK